MPHRFQHIDWRKTIAQFGEEFLQQQHEHELKQNEVDFERLHSNLQRGLCYLCNHHIEYTDVSHPCFHWFINPNIDIKLLKKYFKQQKPISYFRLYTYLTWVANTENPFININDTDDFNANSKIFEGTIRYKNIEWSFSLGKSDFEGHKLSAIGQMSHYHFQMKINDKIQIRYKDTHIPFTPADLLYFEMIKQEAMVIDPSFSAGIKELMQHVHVTVCEDNSALFVQQVSANTVYKTVIPYITSNQLREIDDVYSCTNLQIHEIVDKLNAEKGYNIKYCVYESSRDNPIEKILVNLVSN